MDRDAVRTLIVDLAEDMENGDLTTHEREFDNRIDEIMEEIES